MGIIEMDTTAMRDGTLLTKMDRRAQMESWPGPRFSLLLGVAELSWKTCTASPCQPLGTVPRISPSCSSGPTAVDRTYRPTQGWIQPDHNLACGLCSGPAYFLSEGSRNAPTALPGPLGFVPDTAQAHVFSCHGRRRLPRGVLGASNWPCAPSPDAGNCSPGVSF